MRTLLLSAVILFCCNLSAQDSLPNTISKIKPSIVAIGIYNPTAAPRIKLIGTGFVAQPGNKIITNHHVISSPLDSERMEEYIVLSGTAAQIKTHKITDVKSAPQHDVAILYINEQLPYLTLSSKSLSPEGSSIAFTGFPITAVLGLYPATHRGIISAVTPIVIPADSSKDLQSRALRQLQQPYLIYQLDATAYPGNSGSPVFLQNTGEVIGILNQVYVKSSKENVLSDPSGISYAIPIQYAQDLLDSKE